MKLSGIKTEVLGRNAEIYAWPMVMLGVTAGGKAVPVQVTSDGSLVVGGGSSLPNVVAAPANVNDLSMFPGGVVPASGVYFSFDSNNIYTLDADNNETQWQFTPRAS